MFNDIFDNMFANTKVAWLKLRRFLRAVAWVFNYGMNALMIIYLSLAIAFDIGNFIANVILLPTTVAIFIITIIFGRVEKKPIKRRLRTTKKVLNWGKIAINAFSLGVTLYGMFIAASMVSPISIILTTLLIIVWMIKFVVELVTEILEYFMKLFIKSFTQDIIGIKQNYNPKVIATETVELVKSKADETLDVVKSGATSFAGKVKNIFKKSGAIKETMAEESEPTNDYTTEKIDA